MGCGTKCSKLNQLIKDGNNEEAKKIIDSGYNVNKKYVSDIFISIITQNECVECTPLCTACECKNYEMIAYLLENNADPNMARYGTQYPFEIFLSHSYENEEIFNLFLEKGVDLEKHMIIPPEAALMSHYFLADPEYRDIMERELLVLISEGVEWSNENEHRQYGGYSLLHYVASTDRVQFMEVLLSYPEAKEYINSKCDAGFTPYMFAEMNEQLDMCELLKQYGALEMAD